MTTLSWLAVLLLGGIVAACGGPTAPAMPGETPLAALRGQTSAADRTQRAARRRSALRLHVQPLLSGLPG